VGGLNLSVTEEPADHRQQQGAKYVARSIRLSVGLVK
jgi:hypothetical protein